MPRMFQVNQVATRTEADCIKGNADTTSDCQVVDEDVDDFDGGSMYPCDWAWPGQASE
jgi:hypothetical protein